MMVLFTILKRYGKKKIMVFFSTCMSVEYHHKLFNYIDLPVMSIHVSTCIFLVGYHQTLYRKILQIHIHIHTYIHIVHFIINKLTRILKDIS